MYMNWWDSVLGLDKWYVWLYFRTVPKNNLELFINGWIDQLANPSTESHQKIKPGGMSMWRTEICAWVIPKSMRIDFPGATSTRRVSRLSVTVPSFSFGTLRKWLDKSTSTQSHQKPNTWVLFPPYTYRRIKRTNMAISIRKCDETWKNRGKSFTFANASAIVNGTANNTTIIIGIAKHHPFYEALRGLCCGKIPHSQSCTAVSRQ